MLKKIQHRLKKINIDKLSLKGRNEIQPFAEQPAPERYQANPDTSSAKINGTELFSLFTANIIQEQTVFTR